MTGTAGQSKDDHQKSSEEHKKSEEEKTKRKAQLSAHGNVMNQHINQNSRKKCKNHNSTKNLFIQFEPQSKKRCLIATTLKSNKEELKGDLADAMQKRLDFHCDCTSILRQNAKHSPQLCSIAAETKNFLACQGKQTRIPKLQEIVAMCHEKIANDQQERM